MRENIEKYIALYRAKLIDYPELKRMSTGEANSDLIEDLLNQYTKEKSKKTVEAYRTPLNALGVTNISSINYNRITSAIASWKANDLSPNSINSYVRHIVSFRNDAYRRGLVDSPIARERVYRQRVKELEIKSITREDFRKAIDKASTRVEYTALRMYLLSFIGRGLYYGDFKTLNPEAEVFTHYRQKTGNRMVIDGLGGMIRDLLNTIPVHELNPRTIRKYQEATKRLLGVTFKTARKTFDSYALLNDIDFQIRLHLLGQRDNSIKRYYTNFEMRSIEEKVHKAHRKVVESFGGYEFYAELISQH